MTAEQLRSIGCGPIGAIFSAMVASLIFRWQVKRWAPSIPKKVGKKRKKQLLEENKNALRVAKTLSLAGFLVGYFLYALGWMGDHDWRGLGIGAGLAALLPVSYLAAANAKHGTQRIGEAMVALAIDQKTPAKVLFVLIGLCLIGGVASAIGLVLWPL
ncbi:MAG TPA: hypothetical protein VH413_02930 [Verrucomicrobiae bacterium]|jgi:uncharacterized membrane protein YiaA|nr:hypothetical protein [Verrucomicrobiae bacterium]